MMEEIIPEVIVPPTAVKEEPIEPPNDAQQLQMQITTNNDDAEGSRCTPESRENEVRYFLSKCVFCNKSFTYEDEAKLLECLHAACSSCISAKLSDHNVYVDSEVVLEGSIVCPTCNVASQGENLIENRFHTKFMDDELNLTSDEDANKDDEEEKKCTSCHDNATATSWCVDCEEFICQNCVMAHQRLKITKDHTIKPKEQFSRDGESIKKSSKKTPSYLFCSVHPHEQLSLFCQTCDRLTCRDCQLTEHRDHRYKFIHEIAAETKSSVQTLLKEVTYKRVLLKSAMKVIEDRQVLIVEKKKNLVQDITQMVVQMTNAINTRGKQLVLRLNEVCDQKQNTLNEKRIALDQLSKLTDHCIQFVTYALEKGSDMDFLYSKKSVTGHLQRIKNRRADIPNPEIPVRIHLFMDKVPDLIKVVSSIGSILVDGRVFPSQSPSSGTSTPTTLPPDLQTERKQTPPVNAPAESPTVPLLPHQPISTQTTTFTSVPMSFNPQPPLVNQPPPPPPSQPPVAPQHYPPQYSMHTLPPRSSPQSQPPRLPYNVSYNGAIRHQLMMPQRPLGNCHQQVTSSTHPQQVQFDQMGQNANLRGLLAPFQRAMPNMAYRLPPGYRYPANNGQRALAPATHTYQPTNPTLVSGGRVQQLNPAPGSQMNPYPGYQQAARWHIPQSVNPPVNFYHQRPMTQVHIPPSTLPNDAYKIILKSQQNNNTISNNNNMSNSSSMSNSTGVHQKTTSGSASGEAPQVSTPGQTVTSSVPKTPSPVPGKPDETEKSLDKFCQKSLNDLMLTIAKLDSNGIVVIPEAQKNQLDSSQVDSSTDEGGNIGENVDGSAKEIAASMTKDDPNEDWCAVCMDGGDAVLCCDKCPKVFHLYCHVPALKTFPDESETWQCMLCTNVLDTSEDPPSDKRPHSMSPKELRIAQRIVLELYCQYEQSLPFREIVSPEIVEYHRIIKKPMALDVIREKLKSDNSNHYSDLRQVFADIRLMFKNAFSYNPVDSQVYQEARNLEEFFEKLLLKWAPNYAYDDPFLTTDADEDEEVFPPNRKYRRIIND
ncbi:E3 ubiquitin-protein ligase TRIM33 [Diachasmimorpha longicaudata]|uniref:E3 ubiquitin-protein ligase TRIM33 n=1 Tax=Diachasmimorpha longicaudata TaxID=58733 RepID=UPI0030B9118B